MAIETGVEGFWGGVAPRSAREGCLRSRGRAAGDGGALRGGARSSLSVSGSRGGSTCRKAAVAAEVDWVNEEAGRGRCSRARRRAAATPRAEANRWTRSLARALASTGTTASGTTPSRGAASSICFRTVATGLSPRKGTRPVNSSKTTMPSE